MNGFPSGLAAGLRLLALLALSAASRPLAAAPAGFYLCAALNKGYVTGSKITTVSGLFKRDGAGGWQHIGYNDLSITAAAFDPRDHSVIYTAAVNGCWRTLDAGKTWRCCTSWDMTEPMEVSVDPHAPDNVYLALPDGIAVSPDRGQTWRQTNGWDITEGRDVAVDPRSPDHVYLALPDGVAVSPDRAQTWVRRENGLPERGKYTQAIHVDRAQAGRVLAGCETGIYLTENGAQSWRRVFPTQDTVTDLQQSPADPKLWLAATQSAGALISRDGGLTWALMTGTPTDKAIYNITFDGSNPARFALCGWTIGVMTSEDSGATWTERNAGLPGKKAGFRMPCDPPPHSVWRVGVDPDSGRLYASVVGEALYVSDDFGRTWKSLGLEGSAVNRFIFLPHAGN